MIGIIGGSGVYEITQKADSVEKKLVKTDYGEVEVSILDIFNKTVAFIPRHAAGHSIPPHKINFRANIDALRNVGYTDNSYQFCWVYEYGNASWIICHSR